ncbi:hypothetical protein [Fodinicola acaciae]|uniref:hypothetical protein n=1 Tax=Fodinicola acaciae TaxID=2681555 RepID=UPI0013D15A96|nr:hypothetical protein [Fodinicola acaciae]
MRLLALSGEQTVERFGSTGRTASPLVRVDGCSVTSLRVEPGGVIGRHPATQPQCWSSSTAHDSAFQWNGD